MSERTEVSFDAALMMALRADAQKELDELPTPAQLKELYPDTSRWDARLKAALHKRCPVLKRVLEMCIRDSSSTVTSRTMKQRSTPKTTICGQRPDVYKRQIPG